MKPSYDVGPIGPFAAVHGIIRRAVLARQSGKASAYRGSVHRHRHASVALNLINVLKR
jgi:hypothetical protein